MSAQSIARWNNIPQSNNTNLKRPRNDQDQDDDDDDISLVSRSPSPRDRMDVDLESLSKYDEYVRGTAHEVITVETKIKSSNKGFEMLAKQGWVQDQPLGLYGDGRVDPVPFQIKRDLTGLGKINQDVRMIETTVSQRRGLDSERQQKETEDQRRAREDTVARQQALQSEISTTLAAFYCTLCSKQFQNVAQYDEHTNSYAHHHKARMKDMMANAKGGAGDASAAEERKEKERKREEKELRRAAKAAGIKMAKPVASASLTPVVPAAAPPNEGDPKPSGFKKSGWATVSPADPPTAPSATAYQPAARASSNTNTSGSWPSIPSSTSNSAPPPPPPSESTRDTASAPVFRTAGWTSLDTGSSQPPAAPGPPSSYAQPPPPPPTSAPPPPLSSSHQPPRVPPSQLNQGGGWSMGSTPQQLHRQPSSSNQNSYQNYRNRNDNTSYPPAPPHPPSGPPPFHNQRPPGSSYNHPNPQNFRPGLGTGPGYQHPSPQALNNQLPNPPPARTGWQQWSSSSGGTKRR